MLLAETAGKVANKDCTYPCWTTCVLDRDIRGELGLALKVGAILRGKLI